MWLQVFRKRGALQKVMPVWQLSELEGARHLYSGVKIDRLHDLHRKWGGSIRWCLTNALLADNEADLAAGIDSTDVSALQRAISGRAVVNQVCGLKTGIEKSSARLAGHIACKPTHFIEPVACGLLS